MTTKRNILAAMVGVAMLAMPVRALAGDHHHRDWDDDPRPQAWHDQGWHNGWFKNHGDRDDYRPRWTGRNYYQPPVWHREPDRDDYYYQPMRHHEPDADDFSCDADGDDCRPVGPGYYGGSYGAAPYYGKSLGQLMVDRQNEYRTYINLLNRHDSRAANRYRQKVLNPTDQRIAALNGGYVPPAASYNPYGGYPYGSGYNNGYYGNNGYYENNPTMGALGGLVGPLLGMTP